VYVCLWQRDVTPDKTWVVWHHMVMMEGRNRDQIQNQLATFTRPKVSICIVTYNNPSTLKQAIMSIEEQEYQNYEIVVVDDGSTAPDAVQYLEELQLKVSRCINPYIGPHVLA
jgi:cellulose synthase/poly-beta-1,6-N-acetylglucosamine synthase-like glycosyltransferase